MVGWKIGRSMGCWTIIILAVSFMIVAVFTEARAEDEATLELPPPATVEETIGPLDMTFYEWAKRRPITNWFKDKLKDMPPFIRDTDLNLQLRTYYFFDEGLDRAYKEAWAGEGGWNTSPAGGVTFLRSVRPSTPHSPSMPRRAATAPSSWRPVRRDTPSSVRLTAESNSMSAMSFGSFANLTTVPTSTRTTVA